MGQRQKVSPTLCLARQCFKKVPRMTGRIVSKSSSASGEVASGKLKWPRKVTVADGEEPWRSGQPKREE